MTAARGATSSNCAGRNQEALIAEREKRDRRDTKGRLTPLELTEPWRLARCRPDEVEPRRKKASNNENVRAGPGLRLVPKRAGTTSSCRVTRSRSGAAGEMSDLMLARKLVPAGPGSARSRVGGA